METLASLILCIGLFVGPLLEISQNYYISALEGLLTSSLICAFFYDTFFRLIPSGSTHEQFRGILGTGLCYVYLLPLAFFVSRDEHRVYAEPSLVKISVLLIYVPIISQLVFTTWYSTCTLSMRSLLCISIVPFIVLMVFGSMYYIQNTVHHEVAAGMSITWSDVILLGLGIVVQYYIYHYACDSFSLQEGTIISQAVVLFAHQTWKPLFAALWNYGLTKDVTAINHLTEFDITKIELFSEVAVTSGMIVLILIIFCKPFRNAFGFYGLTFVTMGLFSYPVLYLAYQQDFATWMYGYVRATSERKQLFVLWAAICVVSVITVILTILHHQGTENRTEKTQTKKKQEDYGDDKEEVNRETLSKNRERDKNAHKTNLRDRYSGDYYSVVKTKTDVQQSESKSSDNSGITTVTRKIFHIIAVSAFIPGLHYDVTILNCACSSALVIFTFLECMRILQVWPVGSILHHYLNMFRDRQDQGALILTPIYLLVGFSLPVWLHEAGSESVGLFSGVLSLGIGDAAASFIGSKYGKRRWPQGSKTVEGTVASVVAMILFSILLHYSSVNVLFNPTRLVIACVLTSLLEAFTTQIDNLVLPLFMYSILV